MEPNILSIIIGVAALVVGIILGKIIFAKNTQKTIQDAEAQAQKLIADGQLQAETLKKEKLLEAKEKFVQLKSDHDRDVLQRTQKINESENKIKQKEQSINQKEGKSGKAAQRKRSRSRKT
jgi:ribonuclease Y